MSHVLADTTITVIFLNENRKVKLSRACSARLINSTPPARQSQAEHYVLNRRRLRIKDSL